MPVATETIFTFDDSFVRELEGLYVPWQAAEAPDPEVVVLNDDLAEELGVDSGALRGPGGASVLVGATVTTGSTPVAQAYAGHQFGGYVPLLGDGRALLLGEVVGADGARRDVHLKGSGATPFSRGGDGKAVVGPMLREYVIGEAMHGLGIPTSRALAVVRTGELVARAEGMLPGAVLTRVAASHLRVGTFQFAASQEDRTLVERLASYAIARHHPSAAAADNRFLALFEAVLDAQAALIARWMLVGFIHGVMNTDNTTISGESIDYGPCAFLDTYDPATVFSSIDLGGRYAFGNQPHIAQWNLARLAETLLPLIDRDTEAAIATATEVLQSFPDRYARYWLAGMRAKLGLTGEEEGDRELAEDLLALMQEQAVDFTSFFRALPELPPAFDAWGARWRERRSAGGVDDEAMRGANPVYVPRNHLVEEALDAATAGDLEPLTRLVDVVRRPFEARPGLERYAEPAPDSFGRYRTYCGT